MGIVATFALLESIKHMLVLNYVQNVQRVPIVMTLAFKFLVFFPPIGVEMHLKMNWVTLINGKCMIVTLQTDVLEAVT